MAPPATGSARRQVRACAGHHLREVRVEVLSVRRERMGHIDPPPLSRTFGGFKVPRACYVLNSRPRFRDTELRAEPKCRRSRGREQPRRHDQRLRAARVRTSRPYDQVPRRRKARTQSRASARWLRSVADGDIDGLEAVWKVKDLKVGDPRATKRLCHGGPLSSTYFAGATWARPPSEWHSRLRAAPASDHSPTRPAQSSPHFRRHRQLQPASMRKDYIPVIPPDSCPFSAGRRPLYCDHPTTSRRVGRP